MGAYGRRSGVGAVSGGVPDQSQREEMSAAIRAQRERHAVPRTFAPEPLAPLETEPPAAAAPPEPEPEPEPVKRPSFFRRLRGR